MFLSLLIAAAALWYFASQIIKPKNYPPGPRWYPMIGCNDVMEIRTQKHGTQWKAISEMAKEYNTDVLGLKFGHENVVVVFGERNINQVSSDKEFDARPNSFSLQLRCLGKIKGITFVDGRIWREHRMFAMKHLRHLGFGTPAMDYAIQDAMKIVFCYVKKSNSDSKNIKTVVSMCTMNVLWKYIGGEHIHEKKLMNFIHLLSERTKITMMAGGWLDQWPWLRYVAPDWSGYSAIMRLNEQMVEIINDSINKHLKKEIKGSDLMYFFIEEMCKKTPTYTLDQLTGVCLDFLIAGAQLVGNSFNYVIISALRNREMQDKVYNEIKSTIGTAKPTWNDTVRLVYTNAFLAETQRYYTVALFSGQRRTVNDVKIGQYSVPKGSTVLVSLGDLHFDEKHWDEPNKFNPDRFIDENGHFKTATVSHPFGLGRRQCPGQPLAKAILFLTFVRILQKYRIECVDGEVPCDEPLIGMFRESKPCAARFIKREH